MRAGPGRAVRLALLREAWGAARGEALQKLEESGSGFAGAKYLAQRADRILRKIFAEAGHGTDGLALVATGGYGRGELAPYSDLDLLFLLPDAAPEGLSDAVEDILYLLWDAGLKVGHAVRTAEGCLSAASDPVIRTSFLEMRCVAGDRALFDVFVHRFRSDAAEKDVQAFVAVKLAEHEARHAKWGDSRFVLEPNVKEGSGGLRDCQTLLWITRSLRGAGSLSGLVRAKVLTAVEAHKLERAQDFLWRLRFYLHLLAGRAEERLTFDLQGPLARQMGYGGATANDAGEQVMRDYFRMTRSLATLTRLVVAQLVHPVPEERHDVDGFCRRGNWLEAEGRGQFSRTPSDMIRIFAVAGQMEVEVAPEAFRRILRLLPRVKHRFSRDREARRLFLDILSGEGNPEPVLRRLTEAGLLQRLLPDWGRVVSLMQYDMYHVFTVEEHTLNAMGILHQFESGILTGAFPLATRLCGLVAQRRALRVALFLHDICKGRKGDHSELGAELALSLCPRLGLGTEETATISWLVQNHLLMAQVAFRRDLDDPETLRNFAGAVQSTERLRLLTILTTADIHAVGPGRWTNWKAMLVEKLYTGTRRILSGGDDGEEAHDLPPDIREFLESWPEGAATETAILMEDDGGRQITRIKLKTATREDLWPLLSGALALAGVNILDARLFDLPQGQSLAVFSVQTAGGEPVGRRDVLRKSIRRVLAGEADVAAELSRQRRKVSRREAVFGIEPRVLVDNDSSRKFTLIEVKGPDRPGLLHGLTQVLAGAGLHIVSARIGTFGTGAVDTFYVRCREGGKLVDEVAQNALSEQLQQVLSPA